MVVLGRSGLIQAAEPFCSRNLLSTKLVWFTYVDIVQFNASQFAALLLLVLDSVYCIVSCEFRLDDKFKWHLEHVILATAWSLLILTCK